jgi:hypothetical protein
MALRLQSLYAYDLDGELVRQLERTKVMAEQQRIEYNTRRPASALIGTGPPMRFTAQ